MDSLHARLLGEEIFEFSDIAPKQLGISSRQINYWVDKFILPFIERPIHEENDDDDDDDENQEKRLKRIRLNLANAIWAGILKELLDVGVSTKRLAKLAKDIWHQPREDKYADKRIIEEINQKKDPLNNKDIEILKTILNDENLMHTLRMEINPFTDMIKSSLKNRKLPHSLIYIPKTGEHNFLLNDGELTSKLSSLSLESSIVTVPLMPILSKVVVSDFFNIKKDLAYINNIEQQIRDIVVFKKPKSVVIAFENNQIKPITITEQHKNREQLAQYILENKIAKGAKLLIEIRSQDNYKITLISK